MTSVPEWWRKPRRVAVVIDNPSWILQFGRRLVAEANAGGDRAVLCREHREIPNGEVAFYLGCIHMSPPDVLARNRRNLVVHESDLPKGRGFSPLTWQVLEGINQVPVCLLEAEQEADSGPVVYREQLNFAGHELVDEMREILGEMTLRLCHRFLDELSPPLGKPQDGQHTWFSRRRPPDSRLDPDLTIAEQFNLLRVVDNVRYPAFFEHRGHLYRLLIEKMLGDPAEWSIDFDPDETASEAVKSNAVFDPTGPTLIAHDGGVVMLRPAVERDGVHLLAWQHYDLTRQHFRQPTKPTESEHWRWFRRCLLDPNRHLNIILYNWQRAGALRLDRIDVNTLEVSIHVAPHFYRRGIATAALNLARELWADDILKAEVLPANAASHALFWKCGYLPQTNKIYLNIPDRLREVSHG